MTDWYIAQGNNISYHESSKHTIRNVQVGFPTSTKSSFFQAWGIFQYLCLKRPKNTCCAKTATLSLSWQLLKQHSLKCWETKFLTFPESLRTCVALVKHIPIRVPIQHHWNKKKIKKDLSYYMTKYLRYECIMNCTMNPHFAMTSVGIRIVWQGDKVSPKKVQTFSWHRRHVVQDLPSHISSCQNSVVISCARTFWENSLARYMALFWQSHFRVLGGNLGSL